MLSIFSLNSSVTGRLTDSEDAQLVSLNMQNDVQSATYLTTNSSPTNPAPCLPTGSTQVQILAVQLGNGNEVSYAVTQPSNEKGDTLYRYVCSSGSTTPSDTKVIAHDVPTDVTTNVTSTYPFTITCASTSSACVVGADGKPAWQDGWVSAVGITGVTFKVQTPESSYKYQVTAVPVVTANTVNPPNPVQGTTNCNYAVASSGTYASQLCFIDFSPWNANPQKPASYTCAAAGANQLMLPMAEAIDNTPFTLQFCMYVSGTSGGSPITGYGTGPAACGVAQRTGWYDIAAVGLPTYACPGNDGTGSESFLGNNGFYTGVSGNPALYEVVQGSLATVKLTNIQLVNSNGQLATGWKLVTGDAESTDGSSEYIIWQSDKALTLLPNSPNSPIGNACGSTGQYAPPGYNSTSNGLSGVGGTTVECTNSGSQGANHTGTPMLEATTPSSLTVTMQGSGLEGTFLAVSLK
jgi:hypothetical protein